MPGFKTFFIVPVSEKPNLFLIVEGTYHLEPNESQSLLYEVRTVYESVFHCGRHVVRNRELA